MTDRAIPATPHRPPPLQDQQPDSKINWRLRGGFRLSVTGIWTVRTGLILAMISLVLTILVIAIWAVHRSTLTALQRFFVVAAELSLCLVVVAIKLLAH